MRPTTDAQNHRADQEIQGKTGVDLTFRQGREEFLSHPLFILVDMARQLVLLDDERTDWKLDDRTRELGRRGVAEARKALIEASRRAAA
jgi:hypothetical protein